MVKKETPLNGFWDLTCLQCKKISSVNAFSIPDHIFVRNPCEDVMLTLPGTPLFFADIVVLEFKSILDRIDSLQSLKAARTILSVASLTIAKFTKI